MYRFKVKAGRHMEGDTAYNKGDVLDHWNELDKMFPQKFIRLTGESVETETEPVTPKAKASPEPEGTTAEETKRKAKKKKPAPEEPEGAPKEKDDFD